MAIRLDPSAADEQGLPVVSWEEDRNMLAPGGAAPARVTCLIRPAADGVLQFVSVGAARHGAFEEARPWEKLVSFAVDRADQHYYSAGERVLLEMLAGKNKSGVGKLLTTDGAFVILANFADDQRSVPMHLNCADCMPVEAAMLHDRLRFEFLDRRSELIATICDGDYAWPKARAFDAHEAAVFVPSRRMLRLVDGVIAVGFGMLAWWIYWLLRR